MSDPPRKLVVLNQSLTRRSLLEAGVAAALAIPLASACCPPPDGADGGDDAGSDAGSGLDGGGRRDGGTDPVDAGCTGTTCTVDSNTLVLPLSVHPELVPVLGWMVYYNTKYTDPICGGDAILVIQVSQGKYAAFSASCTHSCCTVGLSSDSTGFYCPCHGSFYNLQGQVQVGPAPIDLPTIPVCFDGCAVYVQLA